MQELIVVRTVQSISRIKYNKDNYPDMTINEAVEHEKYLDESEFAEYFFEGTVQTICQVEVMETVDNNE